MTTAIKIENLAKQYRLGEVGTGTISHDLNRWWARIRGKEDPFSTVGQVNQRDKAADGDYVWALKDVNLEVEQGEVLGIIGANGAGKSTLLKLISRITSPTTGSISARGRIASLLEVGTGMHPEMTARENIFLNGSILGMRRHEISRKFDDIIDFAGCRMFVDTPVKRFSSGMRVRLGFGVAAFLEPEILIVDEVLAVGDFEFQNQCIGKMRDVAMQGRTVLLVSHNMGSISSLSDRCVLLKSGSIESIGPTDQIIEEYKGLVSHVADSLDGDIKSVHIVCDESSSSPDVVSLGGPLSIAVRYHTSTDVTRPIVGIAINDSSGNRILSVNSQHNEVPLNLNRSGSIVCRIPDLPLTPGHYTLAVVLGDNYVRDLDAVKNLCAFEVTNSQFGQDRKGFHKGTCVARSEWKKA